MIIIYVLLAVLLITAAAAICMLVFGMQKNKTFRLGVRIGTIASTVLILFCVVLSSIYSNDVADLQTQYNDIMIYHEVIDLCENEQVRFAHYEKVESFNEAYAHMKNVESNSWFGGLLPKDWTDNMAPIDFYFRGVSYDYPIYD